NLECRVAVVKERHVVDAERLCNRGVAFVTRTADGVEAFAARLQLARDAIELATQHLRLEELNRLGGGKADILRGELGAAGREILGGDTVAKTLMNGFGGFHGAA